MITEKEQMAKANLKGNTVKEYLEKFPALSKRALAEKIVFDYPLLYTDMEDARRAIRYWTGSNGDYSRSVLNTNKYLDHCKIPKSVAKKPRNVQLEGSKILWISDTHIPNHDEQAISLALEYGQKEEADCIVLGGDVLDNAPFTRWDKPPTVNQVRRWFDMAYDFLFHLRMVFPKAKIYWLEGNHDKWYERWLMKKAPILFDDPHYKMETRLKLDELDIQYIPENIKAKAGHLFLLHGHTLIKGVFSPVNGARGLFLRAKSSAIIGHVHSSSKHSETNLKGQLIGCWTVGCLCTLSPDYDPHNTKHNLGFAFIKVEPTGEYHVDNKEIYNGKIL